MAGRGGLSLGWPARPGSSEERARAQLAEAVQAGREHPTRASERLGAPSAARPSSPLVWLHADTEDDTAVLLPFVSRFRHEHQDVSFLVTTRDYAARMPLAERLPEGTIHQYLPYEREPAIRRFLEFWHPEVTIWASDALGSPILASAAKDRPVFWVNAELPDEAVSPWRWLRTSQRAALRRFDGILAADGRSAGNMLRLGVPAERVYVTGPLAEGPVPPPCHSAERETLAELLAARPIWLAAGINEAEIASVTQAHAEARKRSHRLLLVIIPGDLSHGESIAEALERQGWVTALRSTDEEPIAEIEIYVADLPDELGLWYRLAQIAFMGGTLNKPTGRLDPLEPAALGAAIIHGPLTGRHGHAYARLSAAGATRQVSDAHELAREIELLQAPARLAEMARGGWEVTTQGAEATDRLVALIRDALDTQGF